MSNHQTIQGSFPLFSADLEYRARQTKGISTAVVYEMLREAVKVREVIGQSYSLMLAVVSEISGLSFVSDLPLTSVLTRYITMAFPNQLGS